MTQQKLDKYEIMDVSLLAGKIMLESGAETYRVEDTMMRIAASYGIKIPQLCDANRDYVFT